MTRLESRSTVYKEFRRRQILKSEENVQRVQNLTDNEYLNPFDLMDECLKRKLFHLSSGIPLKDGRAYEILNTFCKGQSLCELFRKERLVSFEKASKKQFYVNLDNLCKVHYEVKKWKKETCRSESEYIKRTS